jgi:predicted DNA-binding transcriptional regulator AlpA
MLGMSRPCNAAEVFTLGATRTQEQALALTRREAAELCRISVQTFDTWVRRGILPGPITGTRRWSRREIEQRLAGEVATPLATTPVSSFEQWKRDHAH